jgi:hypothetical protein
METGEVVLSDAAIEGKRGGQRPGQPPEEWAAQQVSARGPDFNDQHDEKTRT